MSDFEAGTHARREPACVVTATRERNPAASTSTRLGPPPEFAWISTSAWSPVRVMLGVTPGSVFVTKWTDVGFERRDYDASQLLDPEPTDPLGSLVVNDPSDGPTVLLVAYATLDELVTFTNGLATLRGRE